MDIILAHDNLIHFCILIRIPMVKKWFKLSNLPYVDKRFFLNNSTYLINYFYFLFKFTEKGNVLRFFMHFPWIEKLFHQYY